MGEGKLRPFVLNPKIGVGMGEAQGMKKGFTPLETIGRRNKANASLTGFTLMEIMVVVVIVALLAGIAIPGMFTAKKFSNEANAKTVLMTISTACENYAASNNGDYPTNITNLTNTMPPYLTNTTGLNSSPLGTSYGYIFDCAFDGNATGYNCTAAPQACNSAGTKTYTIVNGGNLTSSACE